jgi:hypothetical protein
LRNAVAAALKAVVRLARAETNVSLVEDEVEARDGGRCNTKSTTFQVA